MLSRFLAIIAVAAVYVFGIGSLVLIVIGATGLVNPSQPDAFARAHSSRIAPQAVDSYAIAR